MPWIKVMDGWRCQLVNGNPLIAGDYWFKQSDVNLYKKTSTMPETWMPENNVLALQALDPVPLDSCTKPNAKPYDVSILLPFPRRYRLRARLPLKLYFDVPYTSVTPVQDPFEECYVGYTFQEPLASALQSSGMTTKPPALPIRLIFGYQSSVHEHSGFGLFHIMHDHGGAFRWDFAVLDTFLRTVFSGSPGKDFLIFQDEDHEDRWILGPVAKSRQIVQGTGEQKVHFMVVLEQKDTCYKIVTAFNKGFNTEYKERAEQAINTGSGATFTLTS